MVGSGALAREPGRCRGLVQTGDTPRGGGCSIIHTFEVSWLQQAALGAWSGSCISALPSSVELVGSQSLCINMAL